MPQPQAVIIENVQVYVVCASNRHTALPALLPWGYAGDRSDCGSQASTSINDSAIVMITS
jgi:hypothetical protein